MKQASTSTESLNTAYQIVCSSYFCFWCSKLGFMSYTTASEEEHSWQNPATSLVGDLCGCVNDRGW